MSFFDNENPFEACVNTESKGEKIVEPFLRELCYNKELIKTRTSHFDFNGKNPGSHLQLSGADYVGTIKYPNGNIETTFFDFKIEKTNPFDNFLVETVSNINIDRPGWFIPEKKTDYICNYHIDTDVLIIWNFQKAVRWFYNEADWSQFKKTDQKVYKQENASECFLIPIKEMLKHTFFIYAKPKSVGVITNKYDEFLKEYDFKLGGK